MSLKMKKKLTNPIIIAAIIGLLGTVYTAHFSKPSEHSKNVNQSSYAKQSPNINGNYNSITYEKSSK